MPAIRPKIPGKSAGTSLVDASDEYGRNVSFVVPFTQTGGIPIDVVSRKISALSGGSVPAWYADQSMNFTGSGGAASSRLDFGTLQNTSDPYLQTIKGASWFFDFFLTSLASALSLCGRNDGNAVNVGYYVGINGSGQISFAVEGSTGNLRCHGTTVLTAGKRYVVLVTYDGVSTTGSGVRIYVNGVQDTVVNVNTLSGTQGTDAAKSMFVGSSSFDAGYTDFTGRMFLVALWRARILDAKGAWDLYTLPRRILKGSEWTTAYSITGTQTLLPSGLASAEAEGTAYIDATIGALGLASGFAAGNATVIGGTLNLFPSGKGPDLAIGVPLVAGGAIMPAGLVSGFGAGVPLLLVQQIIQPNGKASDFAAGVPRVAHSQSVFPSGVATHFAAGNATLTGSPRYLKVTGVPPGQIGVPRIIGGAGDLAVYIGGALVDGPMLDGSVGAGITVSAQTIGRWTAQLSLFRTDGVFTPAVGQTVVIIEQGFKLFAGCIQEVQTQRLEGTAHALVFTLLCVDKSGILDHRVVTGATYAATEDGADVVRKITALYLNREGVTTGGVPATLGTLDSQLVLNYTTVTNAFDQIAALTATVWWIDNNGVLFFSNLANLPAAPFSISETSGNWIDGTLKVRQTTVDYRNVQYAVSDKTVVPVDPAPLTKTITLPDPNAVLVDLTPFSVVLLPPMTSVLSVKVNGVSKPFATFFQNVDYSQNWCYFPGSPYLNAPTAGPNVPSNGDIVEVQYVPFSPSAAGQVGVALAPAPPSGGTAPGSLGTCGSGIYEAVEQVKDITSLADLNAIAAAALARSNGIPTYVEFQTYSPGLAPGQLIAVNVPFMFIGSLNLLVNSVSGYADRPEAKNTTSIRWTVQCSTRLDPGNWLKWFEKFLKRTENALPPPNYTAYTFILGSGTDFAGGNSTENPLPVVQTGSTYDLSITADVPPHDQDLIVSIAQLSDGKEIAAIELGHDSTGVESLNYTVTGGSLFIFQGDRLRATGRYVVSGPNPTAAQNVSVVLRVKI